VKTRKPVIAETDIANGYLLLNPPPYSEGDGGWEGRRIAALAGDLATDNDAVRLCILGSGKDLFRIKNEGGDVRIVYSPLDALKLARDYTEREVVIFGVGFETTAPRRQWRFFRQVNRSLKTLLREGY